MAEIHILTDRAEDLAWAAAALEGAGHRIEVLPLHDSSPRRGPDPAVALVDAAKDLARGRDACRALHAAAPRVQVVALVRPEEVEALGPDWGVDTFLVEGASAAELVARVRIAVGPSLVDSPSLIRVGDLTIDPESYQVRVRGRPLDLTYKEFQLLTYLAERPGRVLSRSRLLQEVWGYDFFGGTRTVDVHIRRLRAKLGAEHEGMIATVRNVGYKLEVPSRLR
jgi:DNA-binding response OmpR family regulator